MPLLRRPRPAHAALCLVLALCGCSGPSPAPSGPSRAPAHTSAAVVPDGAALPGWRLVWNDEFSGRGVDTTKWSVLDQSTFGEGNGELACLLKDNVALRDGTLVITAAAPAQPVRCGDNDARFPHGRSYTSGFVESKGKASFEYGRFEIRAQVPTLPGISRGLWPAFWLRPQNSDRGELDVMEIVGTSADTTAQRNRVMQTIHDTYGGPNQPESLNYNLPSGALDAGFHTFAVEWEPGAIRWYVDDRQTFARDRKTTPWIDDAFTGPFFLRLNMAVGGTWAGSPEPSTAFPAEYVVDWVRVYQR